jgi:hypothetical protein
MINYHKCCLEALEPIDNISSAIQRVLGWIPTLAKSNVRVFSSSIFNRQFCSSCLGGSIGRASASGLKGPRFVSSARHFGASLEATVWISPVWD